MELKREQVEALIQTGQKKGFTGKEVIDGLVRKGYQPEGVDVEAVKASFPKPVVETQAPSMFERVKTGIQEKGQKVQAQIAGEGQFADKNAIERGVGATATGFSALSSSLYNVLPEVARNTLDKIGGGIGNGINYLADKISENPALQKFASSESGKDTERVMRVLSDLGVISGEILGADQAVKGAKFLDTKARQAVDEVSKFGSDLATEAEALRPDSSRIMDRVARLKPTDATKFKNMTGKTQGEYLNETGNFGAPDKIIQNEATKFVQTLNSKDAELAKLPGIYKDNSITEAAKELVKKAQAESSGGVKAPYLKQALELQAKAVGDGVNQAEINILKRLFEKHVKLGYNKLTADSSVIKKATNIDTALRQFQDETAKSVGFTNLPEINKQIQTSKFLVDKLGDEIVGKNGLNELGLTDWIMLSGGDATSVAGFLTKKFFSDKGVKAKVAEMFSQAEPKGTPKPQVKLTPEGLERQVSPKGLKQLEAPKAGAPKSQIDVPINQPTRKMIEQGTEIVPRTSKQTPQLPVKKLKSPLPKSSPKSATKSTDLISEAKKYKSAEEFTTNATELTYKNLQENPYSIKAYGKDFNEPVEYYRAGAIRKNGDIWLTDNQAGAQQYSSAGGGTKVGSYIVNSKKPLIIDTAGGKYAKGNIDINKILTKEEIAKGYTNNPDIKQKFIDYAKDNGHDAVQFADSFPDGEGGMRSLVVWDKNKIKTKSQLEEIWKKANKK